MTQSRTSFKSIVRKVLIILLLILVAIQFIRPAKNDGEALSQNDYTHYLNVPDSIHQMLVVSCFDCHSNHTDYPWYSYINPVGMWLADHIKDGKRHLNFSDFSKLDAKRINKKLEETAELVEEHEMPLSSYTLIHTDANLSESQVKAIVSWAESEKTRLATK
jgi:hypothetical protein